MNVSILYYIQPWILGKFYVPEAASSGVKFPAS